MENNLQIFTNENFGSIRSVEINDKPYFVANDIARALGYKRPADAVTMHCKGSVKYSIHTPGGVQEAKVIPIDDLYRLITKSKLPETEKFESWVISEIIPKINNNDNNLQVNDNVCIYRNDLFGEMRTVSINNIGWFCLSDICRALELSQPSKVRERLNQKGVRTIPTPTKGGIQNLLYIDESNLYKTIFQSRKPSAEQFTDWVTDEVLPSIRKTGQYSLNDSKPDSYMIEDPIARAQRWIEEQQEKKELEEKTIELTETNKKLEKERDELIPKAEFGGMIGISNDCITMEEMAKVLHSHGIKDIGRNRLFAWLRAEKVLQRNNLPYQRYLESGFFKVHEYTYADRKTGEPRIGTQTTVTPKGQMAIVHSWVTWLRGENLEEEKIEECN